MKILKTTAVLEILTIISGVGHIYSGVINVGAHVPHNTLTKWALATTMHNSVERHASKAFIQVPELGDHS